MGIYEGYQKFRQNNGTIEFSDLDSDVYGQVDPVAFHIQLNKDNSVGSNTNTLVHELLHLSEKYTMNSICQYHVPALEEAVEKETQEVIQNQPLLMQHLRKIIYKLVNPSERKADFKLRSMHAFGKDTPLAMDPVFKKLMTLYDKGDCGIEEFCILDKFTQSLEERTMNEIEYSELKRMSLDELDQHVTEKVEEKYRELNENRTEEYATIPDDGLPF